MNRCTICPSGYGVQNHHIFTVGANQELAEFPENKIYLCMRHHDEVHWKGKWPFAKKYGLTQRFKIAERMIHERRRKWHMGLVKNG